MICFILLFRLDSVSKKCFVAGIYCPGCSSCEVTHGKLIENSKPAAKGQTECIRQIWGVLVALQNTWMSACAHTHTHTDKTNLMCGAVRIWCVRLYTFLCQSTDFWILSHVPWKFKSAFPLFGWKKKNSWLSFLIGPFTHKHTRKLPRTQTKSWNLGQLVSYTLFSPHRFSLFHIVTVLPFSDSLSSLTRSSPCVTPST